MQKGSPMRRDKMFQFWVRVPLTPPEIANKEGGINNAQYGTEPHLTLPQTRNRQQMWKYYCDLFTLQNFHVKFGQNKMSRINSTKHLPFIKALLFLTYP